MNKRKAQDATNARTRGATQDTDPGPVYRIERQKRRDANRRLRALGVPAPVKMRVLGHNVVATRDTYVIDGETYRVSGRRKPTLSYLRRWINRNLS